MYKMIISLAVFVCLCSISVAWEENTNRLGSDISATPIILSAPDPKLCAQACDNNAQCKSWAMDPNGAGPVCCYLKNAVVPPTPWTGVTSGVRGEGTPAPGPGTIDLTGTWSGDDGGRYYIRQLGNIIWWDADGTTGSWGNVAHGTISSNTIRLDYADVPEGNANGFGTLVLDVISNNELKVTEKPASYGGSHLQRVG